MSRYRRRDEASTHVLEAIVIVSIMVSAVAFVVTVETPSPPSFNAREGLEVKARDVLDILYDTPVTGSNFGKNELSAYIAKCLNKQCTELEEKLGKLVPPGTSYALYVSNGYDTYPLLVQGKPKGEAVSATRTFEPDWSSTFVATATESIGPSDALLTYALPIFHSTPVSPAGSQIFVKVSGTRVSDGSDYVLIASAATTAQAATDPTAVAASLYFVDGAGNPLPVHDLAGPPAVPHRMTLRLEESQNVEIPAGTEVTIHTPRGWTATAPQGENPHWTVLANADDKNGAYVGSAIRATLNAPLRDAHRDLLFDLIYHGDVLDYYPLTATLTKGANAMASTILRGDEHETVPALATPLLHMSVPSPMGRGAETTWTLSAYIPVNPDPDNQNELPSELRSVIRVNSVELIEQEGNAIFSSAPGAVVASPTERMGGVWTSTGSALKWEGEVLMDAQTPLNLTFRVAASGIAGPPELRSHFIPPVEYDEWTGRLVGRTGWGFYRQAILPADDNYAGYDPETAALGIMHPLKSNGIYRQTELPGSIQYNVSLAGAVQDSLYGSYVIAEERSVPLGGEVVINANVQSVLFALAEAGQRAGVTLRFYPPWSGDERIAEFTQPNLEQNLIAGEVSQMVTLDINDDGIDDPVIGTSNGRVIAYDGSSGQRLQGNAYNVPVNALARTHQAVPKVTALETVRLHGADYIVVGTDKYSDGVYVLDKDFNERWTYKKVVNSDVLAVDVSTSFDDDEVPEILLVRSHEVGGAKYGVVYVLKAPSGSNELEALPMKDPPVDDPDRLAMVLGTPRTILGSREGGPRGSFQNVLVPMQSMFEPGLSVTYTSDGTPGINEGPSSTPRAGLLAINEVGETDGTLFGAPAAVLRDYDYDRFGARDVILGGSSGYVIMANGSVLTQPIYSYVVGGWSKIVSADTPRHASESYVLTQDGQVIMTDDAWVSMYGPLNSAIGAKAITSNAFNNYWVVGIANQVWRSVEPPEELASSPTSRHPHARDLAPFPIAAKRGGQDYDFASNIHEFRDIHMRGSIGYIVGTKCLHPTACTEPIMLKTIDGGGTWTFLSKADSTLLDRDGLALTKDISRVKVVNYGNAWTGWIVGDDGLIAKNLTGGNVWQELPIPYSYDLRDIACLPNTPDTCWAVGRSGAALVTYNARKPIEEVVWHDMTGKMGLPIDRDLLSVGFPEDTRGYIGATNMVLGKFHGSDWSALPLNYLKNDGRVVSTAGDGGGYVFGGTDANARIWFLHDYHTESQVQTTSYEHLFPADARIKSVSLTDGNISYAKQEMLLNVTTDGENWKTMTVAPSAAPLTDKRKPVATSVSWDDYSQNGRDFRARLVFNTTPDKTIMTPAIRSLTLRVDYALPTVPETFGSRTIVLDPADTSVIDDKMYTADWNATTREIRQPFVKEFWTRNVSGEVHDIRTGWDVDDDGYQDVWVATGDVLSENSPDYIIYAGSDPDQVMDKHNRVYLLSGKSGHPIDVSDWLEGEVKHIRLVDTDDVDGPDILFAATANTTDHPDARGKLYALHPTTFALFWSLDLEREEPADMEAIELEGDNPTAIVGGSRPPSETQHTPHLWAVPDEGERHLWRIIPDDLGKYLIRKKVEPNWLYGPHVVEISVEWQETITETRFQYNLNSIDEDDLPELPEPECGDPEICPQEPIGSTVLRSARFYDHFMVTPPDAVASPNPIYTARLLLWLEDWG